MIMQKILISANTFVVLIVILIGIGQLDVVSSSNAQVSGFVAPESDAPLREVFPDADVFSIKDGELSHHKAYKIDPKTDANALVGYVFLTTEIEPDEWAYGGQIDILVGLDMKGVITGVTIVDHIEPFGYFSIDLPEYVAQFKGKSILDRFELDEDIDAVTGATITVEGGVRAIKKSARQIARRYIAKKKNMSR